MLWFLQVTIWSRYVEALMSAGQTDDVKTVFGRCLMQCPSVDLWFMYLKFIKKVRPFKRLRPVATTLHCRRTASTLHLYC
jgi:hypothetical protein